MLAGGSNAGSIHLWDAQTGAKLFTFTGHSNRVSAVAFSPDGKTLVSGDVRTWRTLFLEHSKRHLKAGPIAFLKPRATVSKLLFSPDGKILVSGNGKGTIQLWDVHTSRLLSTHIGHTKPIQSDVDSLQMEKRSQVEATTAQSSSGIGKNSNSHQPSAISRQQRGSLTDS